MGLFTTWFNEAQPEEQGSHCDTGSHHTYQVGNLTDAVEAETEANERGDRVEWMDGNLSITAGSRNSVDYPLGLNCNL